MANFQIITDSSCDLTTKMRKDNNIDYFRMGIIVNDKEYHADLDFEEYSAEQLYTWVKEPEFNIHTSLIPMTEFIERMKKYLDKGMDILYIACTTVLSGSLNFFRLAVEELQSEYPDRKMIGVNSCRAGMPLGLMIMDACKLRDEGKSMDEVIDFIENEKQHYNLCGTVESLTYLRNAGRVKGSAAFFGNLIGIRPIIIADTLGHNYAITKVKGQRKAFDSLFEIVKDWCEGQTNPTIYVGQGMAQEASDYFKERFINELNANIIEYWVGPIIGISCGPGVIHIVVKGKEMTITEPESK